MMAADYFYRISPEVIQGDIFTVNYSGTSVGVYSGWTQILTSGPGGSSLLTGLTIPILVTETALDCGFYSPFDGAVLQKDVVTNFIFSSTTGNPYVYQVYNTSDQFKKFLELSSYSIDWGDGSSPNTLDVLSPAYISHQYPVMPSGYTITLTQTNPWGRNVVKKQITTPYTNASIPNPNGTAFFWPNTGSWSATPINYNFIFSGDAENNVQDQVSSNYVTVPFTVSGDTTSRIEELSQYGPVKYIVGAPVIKNGEVYGVVNNISPIYTAYTIQNIDYYDYSNGTTLFFVQSSGLTENELTAEFYYKNPALQKAVGDAEIVTNLYVERGKNSAYEFIQRLGEVDNVGDLENYGYGYYNVVVK
jgi:hypothetical protein